MRLGFTRHSNRSQSQQLDNPQTSQRPSPAGLTSSSIAAAEDKGYDHDDHDHDHDHDLRPPQPQSYSKTQTHNDVNQYIPTETSQEIDNNTYYELSSEVPTRSQSHRYPPSHSQPYQVTNASGVSTNESTPGDLRKSYSIGPASRSQPAIVEQKKSKSRFFGFSSKSKSSQEQPSQPSLQSSTHNNIAALGRRVSKRQNPQDLGPLQQNSSIERLHQDPDWQANQSASVLPSPHEQDEEDGGFDPYLIRNQDPNDTSPVTYDPHLHPSRQFHEGQGLTVRVVDDSLVHQQYQQQQDQHLQQSPLQYSPQQHQIISQLQTPTSPENIQGLEYTEQMRQPRQYQEGQQNLGSFPPQNQYRTLQNPEVVSQLSHDSPLDANEEQRPPSVQSSQGQIGIGGYGAPQEYPSRTTSVQSASVQNPRSQVQQSAMAPPPAPANQGRKSIDSRQTLQDNRGPPPGYTQGQYSTQNQGSSTTNLQSPLPPIPANVPPVNIRGSVLQREYGQGQEQGRSTPPLPDSRDQPRDLSEMDKLLIKYKKVKGLYFEKTAQVEQLQNTLANQRLSQSRTSLDDNEYATRFQRLDGAIKEIAFSIRKDWKVIPQWLLPFVNQDAAKIGTKEMTAVGRACISRWIADEIFNRCFHPALDPELSTELKRIEQNVRRFTAPPSTQEETDALTSKVVQWRLTTTEGLSQRLNSAQALDARSDFTNMAVSNLTAHLLNHLQDGSSAQNIQGNATSIIELAVGIASHLPLESRDIVISYPLPGEAVASFMKVEQSLPALDNPGQEPLELNLNSNEDKDEEATKPENSGKLTKKQDKSKSMLAALGPPQSSSNGKKLSVSSSNSGEANEKFKDGRIRFAGFMGVEVRGRQWLYNPPVWTIL